MRLPDHLDVEPMTGAALVTAAVRLFGERGWQKRLALALNIDVSTVRRYIETGNVPVVVSLAVERLIELDRAQRKAG